MNFNPDRARSRMQNMTNTQLWKLFDKHIKADHVIDGRKPTRKRLIERLMRCDEVLQELGAKDGE